MAMFQLVTKHLYFGVDAMQLQIAAGRVLMRVVGRPPERATVGLDTLAQDFGMSTRESLTLVDQMVLADCWKNRTRARRNTSSPTNSGNTRRRASSTRCRARARSFC